LQRDPSALVSASTSLWEFLMTSRTGFVLLAPYLKGINVEVCDKFLLHSDKLFEQLPFLLLCIENKWNTRLGIINP